MIQAILTFVLILILLAIFGVLSWAALRYWRETKSVLIYARLLMESGPCQECGHEFGDHLLVNRTGDPMDGGEMFCPVDECPCRSVWNVQRKESS